MPAHGCEDEEGVHGSETLLEQEGAEEEEPEGGRTMAQCAANRRGQGWAVRGNTMLEKKMIWLFCLKEK